MEKKRYDALNTLKGIFIISIAIFHFESEIGKPYNDVLRPIYNLAWYYGNQYFFMVSGFLMCMAYRSRIADGKTDIVRFIYSRVRKIWPLYFLTNAFILICTVAMSDGWREEFEIKRILSVTLMTSAGWVENVFPYNFPTWFICVLLLCYLVFYGMSKLYSRHRDLYYVLLIGMMAWGYILMLMDWEAPFCYHNDGQGLFNFFAGVLVFDLVSLAEKYFDERKIRLVHIVAIVVLVALHILFMVFGTEEVCGDAQFVATIFVLPLLILLATTGGIVQRILEWKPLVAIGDSSMYLFYFHAPVLTVYGIVNYYKGYTITPETGIFAYVAALVAVCVCFNVGKHIRSRAHA